MLGSQVLEIAMGLFFVYLFFSVICSALNEFVAWVFHLRAQTLERSIQNLLGGSSAATLVQEIYGSAVLSGLTHGTRKPAYISARSFSVALMDVAIKKAAALAAKAAPAPGGGAAAAPAAAVPTLSLDQLRAAAASLAPTDRLGKVLVSLLDESVDNLDTARANVERWFNEAMNVAGGFYKRRSHLIVLTVAVAVSLGLNVDTVRITKTLWTDGNLRAGLVAQAEAFRLANPNGVDSDSAKALNQGLSQFPISELPIGWHGWQDFEQGMMQVSKLLGLVLTIVAVSLGAPFWFDMLNKVANLRATGKPPES